MERVVFVEILNRRGKVRNRIRVDRFPVTIGRSYGNDIIIDDRFICPEHFQVSFDERGTLIAEDLDSVNGIYQMKPPKRLQKITLGPDTHVRAGHTVFRFRQEDYRPPPAEIERSGWRNVFRPFENVFIALLVFSLGMTVMMLQSYLSSHRKYEASDLLGELVTVGMFFLLWSGFWSLLNRLVSHSFRFLSHLVLLSVVLPGIILYENFYGYLGFVLTFPDYISRIKEAGYVLWFAFILFGHLSIITRARPVRRVVASVLISVVIFGSITIPDYLDRSDFSNNISFSSTLKPVDKKWLSSVPAEAFFADLAELREEVDTLAEQKREKDAEGEEADEQEPQETEADVQEQER